MSDPPPGVSAKPAYWIIALIVGIGVLAVSTSAIFVRLSLQASSSGGIGFSLVLAASRLAIASALLLPAWRNFRGASFERRAIYYSGAAGIFLAVHFATWITSLSYTSIAASTTLVTTNPIWIALLSWAWFNEKPTALTGLGIAIAVAGGIMISLGETGNASLGNNPLLGNGLALVGAWSVSVYFLLGREAQRWGLSISSHVALVYTVAAVILVPLPFIAGTSYLGYSASVYGYIALMALFPQLIGHTSFNWAVRWVSPTLVTLMILLEPIGASILGAILFDEIPNEWVLGGAGIILGGVAIAILGTRPPSKSSST